MSNPPFFIIRHAEKDFGSHFNPRLRHQDEPISANGMQQAEKLAEFFIDKKVSSIYISEYQRTAQTAAPTAKRLGLTPVVDPRLNEFDNGRIEGMTNSEIQQTYPHVWRALHERKSDFRFPEGETGLEAQCRVVEILEEKRRGVGSGAVLFVCHDGLIRVLMCYILGVPVYHRWNFRVDFCGITEITYQPEYGTWKLHRFNHTVA
jgi:broad specificity phosphatase PhoE